MKVLVTGATGFIGGHLIPELLRQGCTVIATSGNKKKAVAMPWFSQVKFLALDFNNLSAAENYYAYFDQPDKLIHLAWEGLPNYKSPFHFEDVLPRQYAFLKNLVRNGLTDLTVTGTCFEYGFQQGCLREETCTQPANAYALAKDCLRKFVEQLQTRSPFQLKWARLFYMYGSGQNPASLFSQLDKAIEGKEDIFNMSGGEQLRDYLPVEDVAKNLALVALQNNVKGIINCCSGQPVKLKELVQEYLRKKEADIQLNLGYYPYPDYEPMAFWGDNAKLESIKEGSAKGDGQA